MLGTFLSAEIYRLASATQFSAASLYLVIFTFMLNHDDPITVNYNMKLFEGTSESTTNPDSRKMERG